MDVADIDVVTGAMASPEMAGAMASDGVLGDTLVILAEAEFPGHRSGRAGTFPHTRALGAGVSPPLSPPAAGRRTLDRWTCIRSQASGVGSWS
jgi:hypothetical protein